MNSEKEKIIGEISKLILQAKREHADSFVGWSSAKLLPIESVIRWDAWNRYVEKTARLSALYLVEEKINALS